MPGFGDAHAPRALELERLGDHADREQPLLARRARDDGRRARARAAAHACGDERHMRAGEMLANLVQRLFSRRRADFRARAGAQALGHGDAELDAA